jgi:hypothetical protein
MAHDIARRHAERAGAKLAALAALRVEGRTFINGEVVPFLLIAQRPNRLRVESFTPLRKAIQVYDGRSSPWTSHTETKGGAPQDMAAPEAAEFMGNADFDGPLVDFAGKGYSVDFAGDETIEGRPATKLLVSRKDGIVFVWVDAVTSEIVKRTVFRTNNGRRVAVDTVFKDFRPVAGVLQPYLIETSANGVLLYVTVVDRMEANPPIPAGTFERPKG